ncbi:CMRF35-like molecule 8 isoform X2 [Hemibagrus wyckioides]|uniref:CMRF35-like molecule 8 isoform X2 n=1 Tax=Hemibagrus wyckioides TaxID=337641 RepID=UPI00266BD681|nr:CMRF35-like molecule 8 isoform X2 [Hemibagrus wyckioides]
MIREDFVNISEALIQFRMKKLFLIITFYLISGIISLIFRNLSLQDTGMYQIGEIRGWNHNINLRVKSDPCCGTKTVKGYLEQTLMISCSYPVEFKTNTKSFYRLDTIAGTELIRTSGTQPHQDDRFSISDDRRNKVFSVNITDVREDDVGVYSCVVINEETAVSYHSLFTVIQLREVTDDTPESPDGTLTKSESAGSSINIIIITVVVFVLLLLAVGLVLIFYKLRCKRSQGLLDRNVLESLSEIPHYDEIKDHTPYSNTEENAYYSTIPLSIIPSDPPNNVYATAQLPTIPSDPPNNVYATAQLPTIPSDPPNNVYATAQLPTIPSDPPNTVYTTAQLPTIPSDPPNTVYTTAQLPKIPFDPSNTVYAITELPTIPSDPPNTVYAI